MQGSRGISLYKKDSPGELFRFLFPGLWPEAEGIVSVPGNVVSKEKHP